MKSTLGVFLVIAGYMLFKTKVTKLCVTSKRIRREMQNARLTHNKEIVDFDLACTLYSSHCEDHGSRVNITKMLAYSVTIVPHLEMSFFDYAKKGQVIIVGIILEHGQSLKQNRISIYFYDERFV